jgi:hypothetical protein
VEEGGVGATGWVYRFGCAGERWSVVIEPDHGAWSARCLTARDLRAALREAREAVAARAWKAWGWRDELEYHDMGARWVLELFHDRLPRRLRGLRQPGGTRRRTT